MSWAKRADVDPAGAVMLPGLPPPSGMLVEIKATYKSPCINDIVIRLFPASAGTFQPKTMTKHYLFTFPRKRGDEPNYST